MIATIENMRKARDNGYGLPGYPSCFAYSPTSHEEFSADPGDYWDAPPDWTMTDANGEPMVLVTRRTIIEEITI